jgi:Family of unknown function (DUF6527)
MRIELQRVKYMPQQLQPGILYVSEEFSTAAHLCPCGCGSKIRTPLGPTDWRFEDSVRGPTLWPSIGNWQRPCRSHYWIRSGDVLWSEDWSDDEVAVGRQLERDRAAAHYRALYRQRASLLVRVWRRIRSMF